MQQATDSGGRAFEVSDPMLPKPYRIQNVQRETSDTFTLDLIPEDPEETAVFAPGQFNMLYVFGVGEVPISASGDPELAPLIRHTTRVVGAVTRGMRRLRKGDTIGVRGPFGRPWPLEEAAGRDLLVVAGGIGLAPLRPVLYQVLANRVSYRRVVLLYGTRTPEDILYRSELQRWRGKFDLEVHLTVDRATSVWRGNVGVVTRFIHRTPFDPKNVIALLCGPEVMMRFAVMELRRRGVSPQRIYLSLERNMKCAVGLCGRCQYGPSFICKDGAVFRFDRIEPLFSMAEI